MIFNSLPTTAFSHNSPDNSFFFHFLPDNTWLFTSPQTKAVFSFHLRKYFFPHIAPDNSYRSTGTPAIFMFPRTTDLSLISPRTTAINLFHAKWNCFFISPHIKVFLYFISKNLLSQISIKKAEIWIILVKFLRITISTRYLLYEIFSFFQLLSVDWKCRWTRKVKLTVWCCRPKLIVTKLHFIGKVPFPITEISKRVVVLYSIFKSMKSLYKKMGK